MTKKGISRTSNGVQDDGNHSAAQPPSDEGVFNNISLAFSCGPTWEVGYPQRVRMAAIPPVTPTWVTT